MHAIKSFRRIICCSICFSFAVFASAWAQQKSLYGSIGGTLVDSSDKHPLPFAVIALSKQGSDSNNFVQLTDEAGRFHFRKIPFGIYLLRSNNLGYRQLTQSSIEITESEPNKYLGKILLAPTLLQFSGVTVTADRALIENQADKIIYHPDRDITSAGGVAIDVLKKVPEVTVDLNGNLELQGDANVRVLINGKSSTLLGSNLTNILQAIPADEIQSIEVISSPPARYDAQGTGGIINIVLKKSKVDGLAGNVNLSAGTKLNKGNGATSFHKGSLGMHGNFGGNIYIPQDGINDNFRSVTNNDTTSVLTQNGTTHTGRQSLFAGLGMDWDITPKNNFSTNLNVDYFANSNHGLIDITNTIGNQNDHELRHSNNNVLEKGLDFSTDFKHSFDSTDREFDISIQHSVDHNKNDYGLSQALLYSSDPANSNNFFINENGNNFGKENETVFAADYVHPIKKGITLELGGKTTLYRVRSNYHYNVLDTVSHTYTYDPIRSNLFTYRQDIQAIYASLKFKISKNFKMVIGGRYEYTFSRGELVNSDMRNEQSYHNFIPSVVLSRTFGESTLKLSYTRRIERPEYDELNPFVNSSDRNNITAGNPNLVPERQHRVELGYSTSFKSGSSLNVVAYYRYNDHDIQRFLTVYPAYIIGPDTLQNVGITAPQNIVIQKTIGTNLFASVSVNSKLNMRGNFQFFERLLKSQLDPSVTAHAFMYRINVNGTYEFSENLVAEIFVSYNSPRHSLQGVQPSFSIYSFGIKKQFNNKKGSVGLSITDPFNRYHAFTTSLSGSNFVEKNVFSVPFRSIGVTFSYQLDKLRFEDNDSDKGKDIFDN